MPRRYRDFVLPLLQAWVDGKGCCPPQAPEGSVTSVARRWARHTGVKMRRTTPHPRPWEGQILSFDGLFRGVERAQLTGAFIDAGGPLTPETFQQAMDAMRPFGEIDR